MIVGILGVQLDRLIALVIRRVPLLQRQANPACEIVALGCLRSVGLAARYVSGYLETAPPPGSDLLIGADASHAWAAVFVPGWGWLDIDPTNDRVVGSSYVTIAWGRDYSDVSPLKGIVFGGGDAHTLEVSVDVSRLHPLPA